MIGPGFVDAVAVARELHAGQVRKGTEIPYVSHLLAVAAIVLEAGGDEETAIAALLHDAAEDAGGEETLDSIRARFGDRVAEIVASCSDTFEHPKPDWRERKERYLAHLRDDDLPEGALLVSLADKLHNARAILLDLRVEGDALWARFNRGAGEQVWYYRALVAAFRARGEHAPLVDELERTVGEIAGVARCG